MIYEKELSENLKVCSKCGHHFPMPARSRIAWLADEGSFVEEAAEIRSADPLSFFDLRPYAERLAEAELNTGLGDAIVVGHGTLNGSPLELAVMDFAFMGGSMGSAVAEKYVRACDSAVERGTPLLTVSSSGGARMQEGILSLMTLPKTIYALEDPTPRRVAFDLKRVMRTRYRIDAFQETYFVIDSFEQLFAETHKPFAPLYERLSNQAPYAPNLVLPSDRVIHRGTTAPTGSP